MSSTPPYTGARSRQSGHPSPAIFKSPVQRSDNVSPRPTNSSLETPPTAGENIIERRPLRNFQGLCIAPEGRPSERTSIASSLVSSQLSSQPPYSGNTLLPRYKAPSDPSQNLTTSSETSLLKSGLASARDKDGTPLGCRSKSHVRTRGGCSRIIMLALSVYSTVFSGIYFIIAAYGPVYRKALSTGGIISPTTAQIFSTTVARTIELSFVSVFVAFLGQVLAAEAFIEANTAHPTTHRRGITMAEMAMRSWISEPGTILSEFSRVRTAGLSVLGMLCLAATVMATLYTSAANALVSPKLKISSTQNVQIYGLVKTQFANSGFIESQCQTPIKTEFDDGAPTCLQIWHAGQANHAYSAFLMDWFNFGNGNGSLVLKDRPVGLGLTHNDTSVRASWLDAATAAPAIAGPGGRIINNVTMAMPHAGVVSAAQDPKNHLPQPVDFTSFGEYKVIASVVTAAVNVLCVEMSRDELAPIVFETFPVVSELGLLPDAANWTGLVPKPGPGDWMNRTAVDDIFKWGQQYNRRPPLFYQYPRNWSTLLNDPAFDSDSLYVLGKGPAAEMGSYTLCSLSVSLTPRCSTTYHASASGGSLTATCDEEDDMAYIHKDPSAPLWKVEPGWVAIAHKWGSSLGLDAGVANWNSTNSKSLMGLVLTEPTLNPVRPSAAEALAMLAGCTLIDVTLDTTFRPTWTYSTPTLGDGIYEPFTAATALRLYGSGGNQNWEKSFFPILAGVFLANAFVLAYLLFYRRDHLTDFTEPLKLFALAVSSPQSRAVEGSSGRGPEKKELGVRWVIREDKLGHVAIMGAEDGKGEVEDEDGSLLFWSPRLGEEEVERGS